MGAEHVIFIPGVLLVGLTLLYLMGTRAARSELARKRDEIKR